MSMKDLEEKALKLERRQATIRLIAYLTDETDEAKQAPGRYAYFSELLGKHPLLYRVLLDNDQARVRDEWTKVQVAYQTDVRFLHALTIIYWETTLADRDKRRDKSAPTGARQQDAERAWVISTGLWIMLLSADEFWDYFTRDRWTNAQGARVDLTAQQQEELRQTMINDILALHSTSTKQYFAVGNYAQARVHLRCLDMCRARSQQFFSALQQYALPCIASLNDHTLDWIATRAFKEIDEWCVALTADAEKEANDAEAIKNLPDGIRLNYNGGLSALQPFIDLRIPVARVLCAALAWYNGWGLDLLLLEDSEQFEQIVPVAQKVADQLLPLSVKGKGYEQENKLLSEHFLQRGLTVKDPIQSIKNFEEALAWDPTSQSALNLLGQANAALYIKPALEFAENNEFEKAHAVLDGAERLLEDSTTLREARAAVYFAQSQQLAEEGKFRQALDCAQKAYQYAPEAEAVQELLADMQKMAPEEDNVRILRAAEQAFKDELYDQAIREASRIPRTSALSEQARYVLAFAYLGRGVKDENLERSERDLRKALEFCDGEDKELLDLIKKALSEALGARAVRMVNEATPYTHAEMARKAQNLLQEALIFDPDNENARKNLTILRQNP